MNYINRFDSINEELFGIDLKKIKATALEYTKTKEYKGFLLKIDKSLLSSVTREINKIKNKWKSFDNLSKSVISKSQDTNESITASGIILSVFGFHFTMKLFAALKNDWTFLMFLERLVKSGKDNDFSGVRDFIISLIFVLWIIIYTVFSNGWKSDLYQLRANVHVDLQYNWDGFEDYDVKDDSGKEYHFKSGEIDGKKAFIINYKGENIGYFKGDCIYDIQGNKILTNGEIGDENEIVTTKFDLENALAITPNKDKELDKLDLEIIKRDNEIRRLNKEITNIASDWGSETRQDSKFKKKKKSKLSNLFDKKIFGDSKNECMINENLAQAKKILREKGIDYDDKEELLNLQRIYRRWDMGSDTWTQQELEDLGIISQDVDFDQISLNFQREISLLIKNKIDKYQLLSRFERFKDRLQVDNSIGYLGLLTKFIANGVSGDRVERLYTRIKINRDIISNLRDSNHQKKDIFTFEGFDDLMRALEKLNEWRLINKIIRELPSHQKNLVWENGWFKIDDKKKIEHIISCIVSIDGDWRKKDALFAKISSVKTFDDFYNLLSRAARKEPWEFDFWMSKIENEKNAMVTWSSKEENQIVCIVLTHEAIDNLAYSTSWCIVRDPNMFNRYKNKGYQCILFDFNYGNSVSRSILGFTVKTDGKLTDCYDKYDSNSRMPSKFFKASGYIDKKYLRISTKDILRRCEGNVIKYALAYIRIVLNKPLISKFIDIYDADE